MGSQQTKDEKAIIEPWGAQLPGNAGKRTCLITGGILGLASRVQDRFWLKAIKSSSHAVMLKRRKLQFQS